MRNFVIGGKREKGKYKLKRMRGLLKEANVTGMRSHGPGGGGDSANFESLDVAMLTSGWQSMGNTATPSPIEPAASTSALCNLQAASTEIVHFMALSVRSTDLLLLPN